MKTLISDYTFNKATKQVTFTGLTSIKLEQILLITNVTSNVIIYNFADPAIGGTVSGNVLTLNYDTSSMSNGDKLQIFIDADIHLATEELQEQVFQVLLNLLKTTTYARDSGDRMRTIVENSPQVVTLMRNSYTSMNGSTEAWYSYGSWNTVDAREQLKAIQDGALIATMQKWRV